MSLLLHEELFRFLTTESEDPEVQARQRLLFEVYLKVTPGAQELFDAEARKQARIEACEDLATLERWHDQAMEASTVAEALRDAPPA